MNLAQRIEIWELERLVPYARNARLHSDEQVTKIAASIAEFGFTNPILVDSTDGIIAGHGRLAAARSLGLAQVPVIVLDHLTDAQRQAYIVADNRLAEDSTWNHDQLAAELAELSDHGFDLHLVGFTDEELAGLLDSQALPDPALPADAGDEPAEPTEAGEPGDQEPAGDEPPPLADGRKIKIGKHELPLSDEEAEALIERARAYQSRHGTLMGFFTDLLGA